MKNSAKFTVIVFFGVFMLGLILNSACGKATSSGAIVTGTTPTPAAANTAPPPAPAKPDAGGGGKEIAKTFTLGKDSQNEYGEATFNHEGHAFNKDYSADGKSVMGCVECHHTDQPKSSLKPPDVTSERDVVLTDAVYKTSSQKVSECRACHFQDGSVPDGKTMPTVNGKDMNNQIAFHLNCNTCHDAAFKLRPTLKSKDGFATSKDCTICHKKN